MTVTTRTDMNRNPRENLFQKLSKKNRCRMPRWSRIYNPSRKNRMVQAIVEGPTSYATTQPADLLTRQARSSACVKVRFGPNGPRIKVTTDQKITVNTLQGRGCA